VSDGYIIGPTRLHLPRRYDGQPADEPGFGPGAVSLCNLTEGGVYSERFVSFHYPDTPVCAKCREAVNSQAMPGG